CAVGKGPTLYFHGHYDVVPATAEGQFDPHVRDGRIWGRGSADMKGALSSMIHALAALRGTGHGTRVELVLVPGEETGGSDGMARLSEAGFIDDGAVGAVLGEPTSGVIWNGSRGALTGRVRVRGRSAHVGLHYEGANAFEAAVPILNGLLTLKAEVAGRVTALSIEPESARQSILMLGGEVRGGHQFNLVPDGFEFSVERRFNPEEDMEAERSRLEEVVRTSAPPGVSADLEIFQEAPASSVSASDPLVVGLADAIAGVTGARPPVELCPGLLESRFYASRGVPAVAYGPGELEVSHGPEESVELDRLVECAVIYAHLAHAWGGEG
ncbi:MAG: M20/M25/M40 family metallo-hydrolase, partial [Gemmatimonadetes bacterium]|nr:M20/M25/M40 family metallo-hydrolase [Gemmatimonadota bacterium]